jgi:hypothetical protein
MKIVYPTANSLQKEFPKISNLVLKLQSKPDPNMYIGIHTLAGGFNWTSSDQGASFWSAVYTGQIERAQTICPLLFN